MLDIGVSENGAGAVTAPCVILYVYNRNRFGLANDPAVAVYGTVNFVRLIPACQRISLWGPFLFIRDEAVDNLVGKDRSLLRRK